MPLVATEEPTNGTLSGLEGGLVVDGRRNETRRAAKLEYDVPVLDDRRAGVLDRELACCFAGATTSSTGSRCEAVRPVELESNGGSLELDAAWASSEPEDDNLTHDNVRDLLGPFVAERVVGGDTGARRRLERAALEHEVGPCRRRELEAAQDELALLVRVRLAVVEVQRSRRVRGLDVHRDDERDRILPGEDGGAAHEVATGQDRAAAVEHRERAEGRRDLDRRAASRCSKVQVVVVVAVVRLPRVSAGREGSATHLVVGNVDVDLRCALSHDGLDEQTSAAEVELVVDGESLRVLGEHDILRSARVSGGVQG